MIAFFLRALSVVVCALALPAIEARSDGVPRYTAGKTPKGIPFHHRLDPATPFAALNFGMRDLYAITTPGKEGLVSLGGTLVMRGADGAGQTEFTESLKDLAASASVSIGPYTTLGSVRAPTVTLAPAMAMVADALKGAQPTEKLLARIRQRVTGAEAQSALRAETIAQQTAMRVVLGDHPIVRGFDPGRFQRVGPDDIGQWRRQSLYRDRLRIVTSGRLSSAEAASIIDDAFADLPTTSPESPFKWPEVMVPDATVVVEHDTPQSAVILIGMTSIGAGREVELASLANAVLGAGSNSRLWHAVRVGLGSTYGASSGLQLVGPGKRVITLRAAIANDQVKASVEALRSAYAKWRTEGLTDAELKSTKARTLTDFRGAFDEPTRANALVVGMQLASRGVDELYGFEARIAGLERSAVNRFVAERFPAPEQLLTVIVTPRGDGLGATCTIRAADAAERCRKP